MTIEQIQHLLAYFGYYKGEVDNIWGDNSEAACKAFQEDFGGIDVDGIPGVETQKALRHAVSFGIPEQDNKPPVETPTVGGDFPDCPNFTRAEFACKCGCGFNNVNLVLVRVCQRTRNHFGAALIPSSSCRCAKHNAKVGGVYNSRHLKCADGTGHAIDFRVKGKTAAQVLAYVNKQPEIKYAYAIDNDYVHMDIGA